MTLIIVGILILGFLLIATESITNVNKAAVAIFVSTVGWVLYVCYGKDFVLGLHASDFLDFLGGRPSSSTAVKEYIAGNIFIKYVGKACAIVLFLLATRTIVEVLDNNGCFDFITHGLRTRHSRKLLWTLSLVTLVISANLDNLTTTLMMLMIMRKLVPARPHRLIYGSVIVIAANCGGAMTVIGTPTGLMLWNAGYVTASDLFLTLVIPCLLAWVIPTWWLSRSLPDHIESDEFELPYRGDDTRLKVWQRIVMLVVGIVGLWFIPTFHNMTKLSPFLGALCVLAVIWIVNELFNHSLFNMDIMRERRMPKAFYHASHQLIMFVLGIVLAMGVVKETGAVEVMWHTLHGYGVSDWMLAASAGVVSGMLDNFATAATYITLHPATAANAPYWPMIAYATAVGGNLLAIGSMSGLALMSAEKMRRGWYVRHVGGKALIGAVVGFVALMFIV